MRSNASARTFMNELESNYEKYSMKMKEGFGAQATVIRMSLPHLFSNESEVFELIKLSCQLKCCCIAILGSEFEDVGGGLFSAVSFINHSCRPNCVLTGQGRSMRLIALDDINPGEEV